jgi:thermolysin
MGVQRVVLCGALALIAVGCIGESSRQDHPWQRPHLSVERVVLRDGDDAPRTTLRFLETQKDVFKLRSPREELTLEHDETDALGMKHVRFRQLTHGIRVLGAQVATHYDAAGRIAALDANYLANLDDVDVEPTLDMAASRAIAMATVPPPAQVEDEELVVFALGDREPRLAYTHTIRVVDRNPAIWIVTVDAKTGDVLDRLDNLKTVEASGTGVKGDAKKFEVTAGANGGFVLTDSSLGVTIRTLTAANQEVTPGKAVTSTSLTQWDQAGAGAGAAVDAHVNAAVVLEYYKERHARNAIDGAGGALLSTVHFGRAYDNAFWDGTGMTYGDGGAGERAYSVALDVVGHEFSHGITDKTSGLIYQGQSGALNEAFSDIMGAFIEHFAQPDPVKNWFEGEDLSLQGTPFRDMSDPVKQKQPAALSQYVNTQQDNGGVHTNSGIINNVAFLMTVGGTNSVTKVKVPFGIGWEKSEKVWYRANTKYFLETTNFAQAAQGVLQAAKDLALDANELAIVECAWKAVGVITGACATIVDPNPPAAGDKDPPAEAPAGGAGTEIPASGANTVATEEDDAPTPPAAKPKKKVVTTTTTGCNASSGSAGDPLALLLLTAFVVALRLRERATKASAPRC